MAYENRLYFGTGTHKKAYQQLQANPNVEICTTSPERTWIRIRGQAVFDERPETVARVFETMPVLKSLYNDETGFVMAPFYLKDAVAEIADMAGNFKEIKLN